MAGAVAGAGIGAQLEEEPEEVFHDAVDVADAPSEPPTLAAAIDEARLVLKLFLNNKFKQALDRATPWSEANMYPALARGTILFLQAMFTFEEADIAAAIAGVKRAIHVCQRKRRKFTVLQNLRNVSQKIDYEAYTDEEAHAELCYAECLLQRALLNFVEDENLISFVKGAMKIKQCYQSYKECQKICIARSSMNRSCEHLVTGVQMGIGSFNLMISQLPQRILNLLEFVGFSGDRQRGLQELELGSASVDALRGPLCSLVLLGYHTLITHILGTGEGDVGLAERLLVPCLDRHPQSALFLFFAGRVQVLKGNIEEAIAKLEESIESQHEWRQFHHLCFWELMWCYAYRCDWLMAMKYAERLAKENSWSRATHTYLKASFLMMCTSSPDADQLANGSIADSATSTDDTKAHIEFLMNDVPNHIMRIAGKSIPIEKFAMKKVNQYKAQGNMLVLPALEMIYIWNGFLVIGKRPLMLEKITAIVESTLTSLVASRGSREFFDDNYYLALFLKGLCLKYSGKPFQAEMCFKEICENEQQLKFDTCLTPWSLVEIALIKIDDKLYSDASQLLDRAKTKYKGYGMESRLHFRIHSANLTIKAALQKN